MNQNYSEIDWTSVSSIATMSKMAASKYYWEQLLKARDYYLLRPWFPRIQDEFFGCGYDGAFAVFLFRTSVNPYHEREYIIDEFVWVVVGSIPANFIKISEGNTPYEALKSYISLARESEDPHPDILEERLADIESFLKSANNRIIGDFHTKNKAPMIDFPRRIDQSCFSGSVELVDGMVDRILSFRREHRLEEIIIRRESMKRDDLTFLNSNPDIDVLTLWGNFDLSALPSLPNLKELYICDGKYLNLSAICGCDHLSSLYITLDKNTLDTVSSLCQLVDLSIKLVDVSDLSWLNSFTNLESLSVSCNQQKKVVWPEDIAKINKLFIDSYKSDSLTVLPPYSSLKSLRISTANLKTLDGIERFHNLESFGLSFASKLSDISALKHSLLKWIYFEYCPKIYDYGVLGEVASLSGVSLTAQKIKSIGFAKKLPALKNLKIYGTIEDRDLSPVSSAEYVWFDDRKFYPFRHDEPWLEAKNRLCTVDWEGKEICRLAWFEKPWNMKQ